MKKIEITDKLIVLFFVGMLLVSCRVQNNLPASPSAETTTTFPKQNIPLPCENFEWLLPAPPAVETAHAPRKPITEQLSDRERNHIGVKDAKRFAESNTEIIDLSLIPEEEYAFPLPGGKVISPYGGRRRHHSGVDIKTKPNDTIVAAFDGLVRMAKPYAAYGNLIVIRHYNGLETAYSHNSKNLVKPGDRVKAGQPIALTGRTGRATTAHLHFETRLNGEHFNPNMVFNFTTRKLHRYCLICTRKGNSIAIKTQ
ncbi:MAG: M23 family metallopeptidase [bacterium]|nr:M23 family metallopeptidase [bacterium]